MASFALHLRRLTDALSRADRNGVNAALTALVAQDAPLGDQWRSMATLAMHNGEIDLAVSAMDALLRAMGGAAAIRHERAVLLARAGRTSQARSAFELLRDEGRSDRLAIDYALGMIALESGDLSAARELFQKTVAARPMAGAAWLALAMADATLDDVIADRLLRQAKAMAQAPVGEQIPYCYAAGRVLAVRGEHDAAFAAFTRGAMLRRRITSHDRVADAANARAAIVADDRHEPVHDGGPSRAIIVTGLPRSGTTLVEQILASHSDVAGGGEMNVLRLVAQDAGGISAAAVASYRARGGSVVSLAAAYDHLLGQRFGGVAPVIDKSLNTSRFLGLVASAMPDVPIIWIRRDPLDTAWSCFRTHFAEGAAWSLDLRDMADHFRIEDQLHAHWCEVLGLRMLTIDYAALIDDPARWIGMILAHAKLGGDAGPYAPHLTERTVTTSSSLQVRQPINRLGLETALPYKRHLQPFIDAYST